MKIRIDGLQHPAIHTLLNEHLQDMYELSPPDRVHALNLEKLRAPDITFWTAWENDLLLIEIKLCSANQLEQGKAAPHNFASDKPRTRRAIEIRNFLVERLAAERSTVRRPVSGEITDVS